MKVLANGLDLGVEDIDSLLGTKNDCGCGRVHVCDIERVVIRRGALRELPALVENYRKVLLVCDKNTRRVCGDRVDALLCDKIANRLTFEDDLLVPNEIAVARLEGCLDESIDLIVGVGSGVINDLCKHVSHAHNLPYYIVATAPSMDGYASKGAAMLFGGMKITTNASVPRAIIADTEVIAGAPAEMLRAGYGDIIGKYSCLNDWRLSAAVNGEYLCDYVYNLTYKTVSTVAGMGAAIASRDEESVAALMRALVVVGIAMAYMGNSRPASGSEHHLSHYFEVTGLLRGEPYLCHGVDVAYSTYETAKLRQELLKIEQPKAKTFDVSDWESNIRRVYGAQGNCETADGIIALQNKLGWIYEDKIDTYVEKWNEIRAILADSPTPDEINDMLLSVGMSMDEFVDTYSEQKRRDALIYAKDLKDRYTVLWLYNQICSE